MKDQVIHIEPLAPPKPALGAPCNGCGLCCLSEPCPVGMIVSRKRSGRCDALRWNEAKSRYDCGMVTVPAEVLKFKSGWARRWIAPRISKLSMRWIAAGIGCDAEIEARPAVDRAANDQSTRGL